MGCPIHTHSAGCNYDLGLALDGICYHCRAAMLADLAAKRQPTRWERFLARRAERREQRRVARAWRKARRDWCSIFGEWNQ